MKLKGSWYFFILMQSVIYISAQTCNTTDRFNNKWFGADCQYKCHCKNNVTCDVTTGDCPNGCDSGWFGPGCQYADLAKTANLTLTDGTSQDITKIRDGDDKTCAALKGSSFLLHITWTSDIYFTWLRLVVGKTELKRESISLKFPDDVTTQNVNCVKVSVDKIIMDIYCNISKPTQHIVLNASLVNTLCSLYISKGRNVALKQPTNQTSTYTVYTSSNAVDGHPIWASCTHTNGSGESAPTWSLSFKSLVTVSSYTIYNRVQNGTSASTINRLKGFVLRTFDQTNNIVQNYTDTETSGLKVYNVLPTDPWAQVSNVHITATNPSPVIILTLCEVEIFGDSLCLRDRFTYGRDCENICNCAVEGEKCFVSTGNCPSGCKAGYYGQGCNKNCDPGFYGSDCKSNCSKNCSQTGSICDVIDGKCVGCKLGFYGTYCTSPCSSNCKDSVCDINNGTCFHCKAGFKGDKCDEECSYSTYGESCKAKCSSNCNTNSTEARLCDSEYGRCLNGCRSGFLGLDCTTSTSKLDSEGDYDKGMASGVGIGIGVMMAADIVIGIVIYIWFKRRQIPPPKPIETTERHYDHVDPIQNNEQTYHTVDKSGDGCDPIQLAVSFSKNNNSVVTEADMRIYTNIVDSSGSSL